MRTRTVTCEHARTLACRGANLSVPLNSVRPQLHTHVVSVVSTHVHLPRSVSDSDVSPAVSEAALVRASAAPGRQAFSVNGA